MPVIVADGAAPLLKPVIANSGDTVEVSARGIVVNGRSYPEHGTNSNRYEKGVLCCLGRRAGML